MSSQSQLETLRSKLAVLAEEEKKLKEDVSQNMLSLQQTKQDLEKMELREAENTRNKVFVEGVTANNYDTWDSFNPLLDEESQGYFASLPLKERDCTQLAEWIGEYEETTGESLKWRHIVRQMVEDFADEMDEQVRENGTDAYDYDARDESEFYSDLVDEYGDVERFEFYSNTSSPPHQVRNMLTETLASHLQFECKLRHTRGDDYDRFRLSERSNWLARKDLVQKHGTYRS